MLQNGSERLGAIRRRRVADMSEAPVIVRTLSARRARRASHANRLRDALALDGRLDHRTISARRLVDRDDAETTANAPSGRNGRRKADAVDAVVHGPSRRAVGAPRRASGRTTRASGSRARSSFRRARRPPARDRRGSTADRLVAAANASMRSCVTSSHDVGPSSVPTRSRTSLKPRRLHSRPKPCERRVATEQLEALVETR